MIRESSSTVGCGLTFALTSDRRQAVSSLGAERSHVLDLIALNFAFRSGI
jgi:hypothetical protein